jgi:1,2-phenylacetyl-CoA epoxidase catalytic subunit
LRFTERIVRQVALHLASRQKEWLPQSPTLEQRARQVLYL